MDAEDGSRQEKTYSHSKAPVCCNKIKKKRKKLLSIFAMDRVQIKRGHVQCITPPYAIFKRISIQSQSPSSFGKTRYLPLKHVIDLQRAITRVFIDKRAVLLEIVSHETLIAIFNFAFLFSCRHFQLALFGILGEWKAINLSDFK